MKKADNALLISMIIMIMIMIIIIYATGDACGAVCVRRVRVRV